MDDSAPELEVEPTRYGFRYASMRKTAGGESYVRITPFILPWYTHVPGKVAGRFELFHAWVPRDDYTNWSWDIHFDPNKTFDLEDSMSVRGVKLGADFRKPGNASNLWLQDREAMRTRNFTGISGIMNQDHAVQESMGPIYDRTREHLGTSDKAVIAMRRLLLDVIREASSDGAEPVRIGELPLEGAHSCEGNIKPGEDWQAAFGLDPRLALAAR
jgi:hypothetical protein